MKRWLGAAPVSSEFEVLTGAVSADLRNGWQNSDLPRRQWAAFAPILEQMRAGKPRKDFLALAAAVKSTALSAPTILEIGCGSGWNSEILTRLVEPGIRYIGTDYSQGMVSLGRSYYPDVPFVACDAVSLPFQDASCDIVLSGTALMHIVEYEKAIAESRRVTRKFAIFHTVPVHFRRHTTILKKRAYGQWVAEVVFNEGRLLELFNRSGFETIQSIDSIPYDLVDITGERSVTKTYVCQAV